MLDGPNETTSMLGKVNDTTDAPLAGVGDIDIVYAKPPQMAVLTDEVNAVTVIVSVAYKT